jgi:dihydropteroate synthase
MLDLRFLAELHARHEAAAGARVREFTVQGHAFPFNERSFIMGVVNLSPGSWYRESVVLSAGSAVARAKVLSAQGASIVDVGAESSLSQAERVDEAAQRGLLLPVLKGLREAGLLASVETYHPSVAEACLEAGAGILNLTGTVETERIYRMAAGYGAAVILCYVQGTNVREVGDFEMSDDPVAGMREYFAREIDTAAQAGVEKILLDPGLGFYYRNLQDSAVRVRHQMMVFLNSFRLRELGFPVCHALPHAFEYFGEEVRCAEPFFAVLAALGKADLFRTHEVARVRPVLETLRVF